MGQLAKKVGIGIVVALAYVMAAKLGFRAAFVAEQVTTVWAPTGIAQAALLLWGVQLWPAIWAGAFAANVTTHVPMWTAAGMATGNTLEAVGAAWVLSRLMRFDPAFRRTRDAVAFICVAVVASPIIGATIGVTMLCVGGVEPWSRYASLWPDWWLGDALGSLVVAPALLTLVRRRLSLRRRQKLETALLVVTTLGVTELVFSQAIFATVGHPPLAFVIFPFVMIAAVRDGQPGTALVTLSAAIVTVWNTLHGAGPFVGGPFHESLTLSQAFIAVLAGSGLLLAAAIGERRVGEQRRATAYAVGLVLANSRTFDEAAPRVLKAISEGLDWQVGAVWTIDRAPDRLHCFAMWPADETVAPAFLRMTKEITLSSGVGLPGRVWASGEARWIENVDADTNFPRAAVAGQAGLHGAFAFPIKLGGQTLGVVEFFNRSVVAPDPDLLTTMATMGNQMGQLIARTTVEAAMIEGETRTRAILDTALDAIISMDHEGNVTVFNNAAQRMFGYRREDAIGHELATLIIPPRLRQGHRNGIQRYLETGTGPFIDSRVETMALRADGQEFPVEIAITRVPSVPPTFTGFVRDMTDRAHAERERQELLERELVARKDAEAANRAKDEFLAVLSHELRTPLNAIVGWTRMVLDGTLEEGSVQHALEIIDRNAQAQVQLVEDILDVSRIVTGKLKLDVGPVDLGSVIGAALETLRHAADAKHIQIRSTLARSARLTQGDAPRLQQIVWNLLSNAIKFTPSGGLVAIDLTERGDKLCLKVSDTGVGITPDLLPHVFERFRQGDGSTTREHGGLGLGLSIVAHLVELHGGTVAAESPRVGQGATFTVELPKLRQHD